MKITIAGALLGALCAPVAAQNMPQPAAPPSEKPASTSVSGIQAGELRLDGKIKGILNAGEWQMEAISWTSPRDVTTDFSDPKSKLVKVGADAYIHPLNQTDKVALKDVKLGTRVAVIGRNAADGSLAAREIILLEGYGSRKTIGTVSSNPFTSKLIDQSRKAREEGNLPRALALAESAITAAQGINDLSGEGLATQDKTLLLLDMGQPEKAAQSAARVEALGRSISNTLLITMGMNTQGRVLAQSGQLDKAIQILEAADPISAGGEPALYLSTLSTLASVYAQADRNRDVVATLQRILPLEESLRQPDDATETMLGLAQALATTDATKAREYLTQAAPRIDQAADEKKRARLRRAAGEAKFALGDKDGAKAEFETAAKLYESVGDTVRAAAMRALPAQLEAGDKPKPAAAATQNAPDADNQGPDNPMGQ